MRRTAVQPPPLTEDQQRMVEDNIGLVHAIVARAYGAEHRYADDMIQGGVVALMRAVQLYDPSRRVALSTFAHMQILQGVNRTWMNCIRTIHIPALSHSEARRASTVKRRETLLRQREATKRMGSAIEIGSRASDDEPPCIAASRKDAIAKVRRVVGTLDDDDRVIAETILMRSVPMAHVASVYGLTREAMRYRTNRLKERLRESLAGLED